MFYFVCFNESQLVLMESVAISGGRWIDGRFDGNEGFVIEEEMCVFETAVTGLR